MNSFWFWLRETIAASKKKQRRQKKETRQQLQKVGRLGGKLLIVF